MLTRSRTLYVYSHPVNIQGLRFPPIAASVPFGGVGARWGTRRFIYSTDPFLSSCFLPSLKHKFTSLYFRSGRQSEYFFVPLTLDHLPIDPNATLSWDPWTILTVDIRQYSLLNFCSRSTKNEQITTEKSATVLKHMHTSFSYRQESNRGKRALTSSWLLWSNWLSARSWIYG